MLGMRIKATDMAQQVSSADWKKRGGLTGKVFGQPLSLTLSVKLISRLNRQVVY